MPQILIENGATPLGYQQLSSIASSTALSPPTGTKFALITAEAQALRWRDDGGSPTSTVGMLLNSGDTLIHPRPSAVRVITDDRAMTNILQFIKRPPLPKPAIDEPDPALLVVVVSKSCLNIRQPTVVSTIPGRLLRVVIIVPGTGFFAAHDCDSLDARTAANVVYFGAADNFEIGTVLLLDFPMAAGIVVDPPDGGVVAVSFS